MKFKNKELCKIRTITTFLSLTNDKKTWRSQIQKAADFCNNLSEKFISQGYIVQSIRIVTNPFGEYLNTLNIESAKADLTLLSKLINSHNKSGLRIRFAIGEVKTKHELSLLPELIRDFGDLCNACVNVSPDEFGILDNEMIDLAATTVKRISVITSRGEGNFNFTVNFNCKPFIPYFPASYHRSELEDSFVIGLETPDLLVQVLKDINENYNIKNHNEAFKIYFDAMKTALHYHIEEINQLILDSTTTDSFNFAGFDSSAAPSKSCASMVEVYKELGVKNFGAAGTVEVSSLLTRVFKSMTHVNLVGFSGLMLALTEDTGLAERTMTSDFDILTLLTNSAVCGIGLDTVPIPGNTSIDKISALMRDTGTMAYRLNKPLTVRLFPIPNLVAGDVTQFESDDLCNSAVLSVD
tara:strand:+ start:243 stop:1475 length:1233 start_codon:yes stop_codon:yes gene_type:complete